MSNEEPINMTDEYVYVRGEDAFPARVVATDPVVAIVQFSDKKDVKTFQSNGKDSYSSERLLKKVPTFHYEQWLNVHLNGSMFTYSSKELAQEYGKANTCILVAHHVCVDIPLDWDSIMKGGE